MVVVVSVIGLGSRYVANYSSQGGQNYSEQTNNPDVAVIARAIRDFNPIDDSIAQWIMAGFTIVATLLSIGALVYVAKTFEATRSIGQAQVRAYVQVGKVESQYVTEDGSSYLRTFVEFENTGQSPTRRLTWWVDHKLGGFTGRDDFVRTKRATSGTATIGAGRSTKDVSHLIPTEDLHAGFSKRTDPVTIFGAVSYGDVFGGPNKHITEFSFELLRGGPSNKIHEGIKVDVYTGAFSIDRAT